MKELALELPGGNTVGNPANFNSQLTDVASIISGLLNIAFYIGAFMAFYWLIWASFQYILAKGDKEGLAKARSRITWAIIGLMVILIAYLIATYASEIFPATRGGLPF